jgi:hypothetical protein
MTHRLVVIICGRGRSGIDGELSPDVLLELLDVDPLRLFGVPDKLRSGPLELTLRRSEQVRFEIWLA